MASPGDKLASGLSYQQNSYDSQTLDANGNVLTRNIFDFTNSATPIRKYTYTYVTDGNYTSRYMRNKLAGAVVTDGSGNNAVTLVSNQYDSLSHLPSLCGYGTNPPTYFGTPELYDTAYTNLFWRGNPTVQTTPSGYTCNLYDMVGNAYYTKGPHTPATSVGSSYSQPSSVTANGDSGSLVSLSYDTLFLPTSFTGPNGSVASETNDAFGRVTYSTSVDGATTSSATR